MRLYDEQKLIICREKSAKTSNRDNPISYECGGRYYSDSRHVFRAVVFDFFFSFVFDGLHHALLSAASGVRALASYTRLTNRKLYFLRRHQQIYRIRYIVYSNEWEAEFIWGRQSLFVILWKSAISACIDSTRIYCYTRLKLSFFVDLIPGYR